MLSRTWRIGGIGLLAGAIVVQSSFRSAILMATEPVSVDEYRELMLVHPAVIDPFLNGLRSHNGGQNEEGGVWSLRYLLESIASDQFETGRNAFYQSFFTQWLDTQIADNGGSIPPRDADLVKTLLLDRFSTVVDPVTERRVFHMWKLPFELMAIVYRPDLRSTDDADPGELRFVYRLVDQDGEGMQFTLNMEYALPRGLWDGTVWDAKTWAHNFHRLASLPVGSEEYLRKLQALTFWVTVPPVTQGAEWLRHIRTNEIVFDASNIPKWEMREFLNTRPSYTKRRVVASALDDTPAIELNGTPQLADLIAANPDLADAGTGFMVPADPRNGRLELSRLAPVSSVGTHWTIPGGDPNAPSVPVDNFGLLTCNGCHQDNKSPIPDEMPFYHINPEAKPGQDGKPRLSKFLTTAADSDPESELAKRRPGELKRRREDLTQLLQLPWTPTWIN